MLSGNDGGQRLLQGNDGHAFLHAPYERPVRALIVLSFLVLIAFDFLPFYADLRGKLWDWLLDHEDSFDTPIGGCARARARAQERAPVCT